MHASGCTQHPGAYRRSARPSSGRQKKKKEEQKGVMQMKSEEIL
jgi:hypothetical protein